MERRTALAGLLALPLGAGAARAQSGPPAPDLSEAARAHARDTLAAGAGSLLVSRIAQGKLRHPMTRQFADFEVAEQEGLAEVLKARLSGARPSGAAPPPGDAEAEALLDEDGRAAVARFRDMAAGPEFEKSYAQAEVEAHRKLLALQEGYLKAAEDPAEAAVAVLVKGRVEEHLTILGDIGRHLG